MLLQPTGHLLLRSRIPLLLKSGTRNALTRSYGRVADWIIGSPPLKVGSNSILLPDQTEYLKSKIEVAHAAGHFAIEFHPPAGKMVLNNPRTLLDAQPNDHVTLQTRMPTMPTKATYLSATQPTTVDVAQKWAQERLNGAWAALDAALATSRDEESLCLPLAKVVTLLDMTRQHRDDKYFLFVPWDRATTGQDGEQRRQDVIAIEASYEEIVAFYARKPAKGGKKGNLPKRFVSKDDPRIPYACVVSVVELNPHNAPDISDGDPSTFYKVLEHLLMTSRYQPRHAAQKGLLVYADGFYVADYYPDGAKFTGLYQWKNRTQAETTLIAYLKGLRERSFTAQFFHVQQDRPSDEHHRLLVQQDNALYNGLRDEVSYHRIVLPDSTAHYDLYDLHCGHGWTRNSYVAFGISQGNVPEHLRAVVFKHQWCDVRQKSNEAEILTRIFRGGHVPGVVKPSIYLMDRFKDSLISCRSEVGEEVERKSSLVVLLTLGHSLGSCRSLKEFYKAMYDLVEVHRMLVEDHDVHHRDISLTNILINHIHLDGTKDELGERPFIDNIIIPTGEKKVHVALSDFDNAYMGEKGGTEATSRADTEEAKSVEEEEAGMTGTPAFMASDLLHFLPSEQLPTHEAKSHMGEALERIYNTRSSRSNLSLPKERIDEIKTFREEVAGAVLEDVPQKVVRVPLHDMESVFWVIVFFLLRAWPVGFDNPQDEKKERTRIFEYMLGSVIGRSSLRKPLGQEHLPPQLKECFAMLKDLHMYFQQPWYRLGNKPSHRFHGHNAIQSVLLSELERLGNGDVELTGTPLPVEGHSGGMTSTSTRFIPMHSPVESKRPFGPDEGSNRGHSSKRRRSMGSTGNEKMGYVCSVG